MKNNIQKYIPKNSKINGNSLSFWKKTDLGLRNIINQGYSVMIKWNESDIEFVKFYNLK